jgi:hypothetical protein
VDFADERIRIDESAQFNDESLRFDEPVVEVEPTKQGELAGEVTFTAASTVVGSAAGSRLGVGSDLTTKTARGALNAGRKAKGVSKKAGDTARTKTPSIEIVDDPNAPLVDLNPELKEVVRNKATPNSRQSSSAETFGRPREIAELAGDLQKRARQTSRKAKRVKRGATSAVGDLPDNLSESLTAKKDSAILSADAARARFAERVSGAQSDVRNLPSSLTQRTTGKVGEITNDIRSAPDRAMLELDARIAKAGEQFDSTSDSVSSLPSGAKNTAEAKAQGVADAISTASTRAQISLDARRASFAERRSRGSDKKTMADRLDGFGGADTTSSEVFGRPTNVDAIRSQKSLTDRVRDKINEDAGATTTSSDVFGRPRISSPSVRIGYKPDRSSDVSDGGGTGAGGIDQSNPDSGGGDSETGGGFDGSEDVILEVGDDGEAQLSINAKEKDMTSVDNTGIPDNNEIETQNADGGGGQVTDIDNTGSQQRLLDPELDSRPRDKVDENLDSESESDIFRTDRTIRGAAELGGIGVGLSDDQVTPGVGEEFNESDATDVGQELGTDLGNPPVFDNPPDNEIRTEVNTGPQTESRVDTGDRLRFAEQVKAIDAEQSNRVDEVSLNLDAENSQKRRKKRGEIDTGEFEQDIFTPGEILSGEAGLDEL